MKVLIVDDSAIMRRVIEQILESLEHEAVHASHGREALEQIEKLGDVELVLLDWNMPEMDGLQMLQEMESRADIPDIPVIMITTESERHAMIEAIEAGARFYITKPFSPETLATRILQCTED